MGNWSREEVSRYLGRHTACYVSSSVHADVRSEAASGGTTSQILISLLAQGKIDGALVWTMDYGGETPRAKAVIARNREQVLAARGSKYVAVSFPKQAMPLLEREQGRFAVVTLPCDASYLRRRMQSDPELAAKIYCVLTLFCGHNSEPELTEILLRRHGASWPEVKSFRYRTGHWRGQLDFETHEGRRVQMPTRSFTHFQNLHFCSQRKCLACFDHFGYDADLALGDAWSLDKKDLDRKPTMVVVRNARGQEVLDAVREELALEPADAGEMLDGNSRGVLYHYNVSARAQVGERRGLRIHDRLKLPVTSLDKLIARLALTNFEAARTSAGRQALERLPFSAITAYIYAFKALQQLNVWAYRPLGAPMRVSVIGATFAGNRGAQAMLETTISQVRERFPEATFVVHSYFPEEDRALCKDLDCEIVDARPLPLVLGYFPISVLERAGRALGLRLSHAAMPAAVRALAQSRVLLDVSGISFADGREKFVPYNVLCNLPAMLLGVPVVKLSQAMGPFDSPLVRVAAKAILRRCELVCARGAQTYQMVQDLDAEIPLLEATDIAFLFEGDEDALTSENDARVGALAALLKADTRVVVGLYVSEVVYRKCAAIGVDYVAAMVELVRALEDRGRTVVLLPNANRDSEARHNNDLPVLHECLAHLPQAEATSVTWTVNAAGLRTLTEQLDVVVASRFHGMVGALALCKPTLVIGWSHKYAEVMGELGLEGWAVDFAQLNQGSVVDDVERLIAEREPLARRVASHLAAVRASAERQFEALAELLSTEPDREDFDEYEQ